jgi:hypothetical protein
MFDLAPPVRVLVFQTRGPLAGFSLLSHPCTLLAGSVKGQLTVSSPVHLGPVARVPFNRGFRFREPTGDGHPAQIRPVFERVFADLYLG